MLKLMPVLGVMTRKENLEVSGGGTDYIKFTLAVNDNFYFCTAFNGGARYLNDYANIGAKLFIEDWHFVQKQKDGKTYFDIIVNKVSIAKNGGDK